ncbi:MAG: hypothetical protein V2B18_01045 [Pseudomonadota bacterium]
MMADNRLVPILLACAVINACSAVKFTRSGIHRDLDEQLTIVRLTEAPQKHLDKEIVISVRYYRKGDLPCPLGPDYVNFVIADRVSYIMLNKAWIPKDKAAVLDGFKEMDTVVMKAKVFKIDEGKDPNLLAMEIVPE